MVLIKSSYFGSEYFQRICLSFFVVSLQQGFCVEVKGLRIQARVHASAQVTVVRGVGLVQVLQALRQEILELSKR